MIQNHAAADILGRADSEKLEPLQQALFSAHTSAHAIQVSGGTLLCAELSLQTTAGAKFLSAYYSPSKLRNQDVLICVFVDISERKENELIWERAREVTESANQAKSAFLASVSHELRTPLHGMLGGIELLSRMELPPVSREYVNSVWDSAQNLLLIINSVLDFSKIEANKIEILKRPGSIREVAQRVAKLHAIIAEKKALRLFLYVDPAIPEYLIFDAVRVEQILTNLCNNAIKFTDQGRIQIRLELVSRDGEQLLLRGQVIDSGVGMSQQDQAALFQPFFQGDDTQLRNSGGTGLGLAICKRLLDLMGGDIKVLSDRGLGSCFTFTLPVQHDQGRIDFLDLLNAPLSDKPLYGMFEQREIQMLITEICHHFGGVITAVSVETLRGYDFPPGALLLTDAADDKLSVLTGNPRIISITQHISGLAAPVSSLQQRVPSLSLREITLTILESCGAIKSGHVAYEPGQAADGVRPHRGLRVLLVEDHPVNLYILAEQLRMLGCKVLTAQNGREALMRLKDQIIDVVVTDINMPVMDGIEFARNLRLESADLPIVGMTSSVDRELMRGAMEAGMDMCLTKPLTLQHLDDALTAMREKHHRYGGVSAISQQYQAEASPGAVSLKNSDKTAHQIYLSSYRHDIELLTQALQEGSLTNVGDRLHRIEGVLGFLGADASYALSRRVHTELKSTASVSQAIRDDCHILIAEMEALARLYQQENSVGAA
jgi:two-component system capsular synthesis sensor histidine kinase RcsC